MRSLVAGVSDFQNHVPSQAALNVQIPLLVVNRLQGAIRPAAAQALPDLRQQTIGAAGEKVVSGGKRIAEAGINRDSIDGSEPGSGRGERAAGVTGIGGVRGQAIENAVPRSDHGFGVELINEPESGIDLSWRYTSNGPPAQTSTGEKVSAMQILPDLVR